MTKPLPSKVKAQREATRKRESAQLRAAKRRLKEERILRLRRLEIDKRRRHLDEFRKSKSPNPRLGKFIGRKKQEIKRQKQDTLRLERELQREKDKNAPKILKEKIKKEKAKTKKSHFWSKKPSVRGSGVKLSQFFGG